MSNLGISVLGNAKPRRAGWTLLEVAVVVTMTTVIMMLAAVTMATLFRVKLQMAGDTAQDIAVARLASRLRTDAHAAIAASVAGGCDLELPDGRTIRYAYAPPAVTRELRRGGELEHRDAFLLPRRAAVTFSQAAESNGQIIHVSITPAELPARAHTVPARPIEIAAAVNIHRQPAPGEAP